MCYKGLPIGYMYLHANKQDYVRLADNWVYSVYSYKWEHCRSVRNVLFVRRAGLFTLKSLSMNTKKLTIYVKISK